MNERMNDNLYMSHKNGHTKPSVFTAPDTNTAGRLSQAEITEDIDTNTRIPAVWLLFSWSIRAVITGCIVAGLDCLVAEFDWHGC